MRIYYTASIVGKKQYLGNYQTIIEELKRRGHTVIADHILHTTEDDIRMESTEERHSFHKKLEQWINDCDCVVAETSFPSISVGFEINLALQKGKPVLILYNENGKAPSLLVRYTNEKLIIEKYTQEMLKGILEDFLTFASGTNDMRFTFFITPRIATFLEKVSKDQRIPKSVWLRHLIEEKIADTY